MAAPITHIVLAQKIFDKLFKNKLKKDFFIGTCFPDIKYLKVIERSKTHFNGLSLDDLKKDNAFLTGVKFHSILDIIRENHIMENNVYSLCPESKYITQSLKILEDQIYYPLINDWQKYINYFDDILIDEIQFGVSENAVKKWHSLLQQNFAQQPNTQSITKFTIGIGFSKEAANEMNENIKKMQGNKKITDIIKGLYKNFDSLLIDIRK